MKKFKEGLKKNEYIQFYWNTINVGEIDIDFTQNILTSYKQWYITSIVKTDYFFYIIPTSLNV